MTKYIEFSGCFYLEDRDLTEEDVEIYMDRVVDVIEEMDGLCTMSASLKDEKDLLDDIDEEDAEMLQELLASLAYADEMEYESEDPLVSALSKYRRDDEDKET